MSAWRGAIGIVVLCLIAWLLSSDRRRIPWKTIVGGLILQWILAILVLKTTPGRVFFDGIARLVTPVLRAADEGAAFVFGPLAGSHPSVAWFAIAGIKILSTIVVVGAISSLGYHYGILQRIVKVMAWVMTRTLGVTGPESLSGAANVFFGQTEAPLLIRPLLPTMTRSELMAIMTGGFATIAAGVMAYYISVLGTRADGTVDPERTVMMARHLLTASLMAAPAAFVMAKIMVPARESPEALKAMPPMPPRVTKNGLDAAAHGASEGMSLAINVLAMLIAFIALVELFNIVLRAIGEWNVMVPIRESMGLNVLDLNGLLGLAFAPFAWLNGVEWRDCRTFGTLLGQSMATNEMIAYGSLAKIIQTGGMSERSIIMATYSLCGFANLSSIGIQIGGIGSLIPERRGELVELAPRAMFGGAMACWMTGAIAGMLVDG